MWQLLPLSLINVDAKLLSKILASRLEVVVLKLIHQDQVGLLKKRTSSYNLRRLLHLMWQAENEAAITVAFLLDAEEAFDSSDCIFLVTRKL